MDEDNEFQCVQGNLAIVPYSPRSGVLRENDLLALYDRLKQEDLFPVVFHENPELTPIEFLNFFANPRNLLIMYAVKEQENFEPAGLAWLSEVTNCQDTLTRATGSFVFFKKYQSQQYTGPLAHRTLDYWFNQLHIDTIIGLTPENNRLASTFIKRVGFREIGRVPQFTTLFGTVTGAIVTCMTATDWRQKGGGNGQESGQGG